MSEQPLNEAIQQAKKALEAAKGVDKRDYLSELLTGIVKGNFADESLGDQLEEQALAFETDHPKLAGALREVMDALQRMGI